MQRGARWAGSPHHRHVEKQGPQNGAAPYRMCTPLTTACPPQKSDQSRKMCKGLSDAFQKESESVTLSNRKSTDLGAASGHRLPQLREPLADTPSGRWAASPSSPEGASQARLLPLLHGGASAATAGREPEDTVFVKSATQSRMLCNPTTRRP